MATVQREIEIARDRSLVWDAIRDVGAIHKRLVPGFVVDCKLEGDARIVTFADGMVLREVIVTVDDVTCRHVWSARGEPFAHHNASIQALSEGVGKCRVVWIADLLPNEIAATVEKKMVVGLGVMKRALEGNPALV